MAKFRKEGKTETPEINTGSMSDIIFMLLFFFMVITTMRESTLFIRVVVPQATEVQKLEKKSLVSYIYVGIPDEKHEKEYGSEPRIQLNDQIVDNVSAIREFIEQERAARSEADVQFLTTSIKAHREARMGLITEIKTQLKEVQAYKLNYSASRKGNE